MICANIHWRKNSLHSEMKPVGTQLTILRSTRATRMAQKTLNSKLDINPQGGSVKREFGDSGGSNYVKKWAKVAILD